MASNSKGNNRIRQSVKAEMVNVRARLAVDECRKRRAEFALSLNRYDENGMMYLKTPDGVVHTFNKDNDVETCKRMCDRLNRYKSLLEFMPRIAKHTKLKCLKGHTLYYVSLKRMLNALKKQRVNVYMIIGMRDKLSNAPRRATAD